MLMNTKLYAVLTTLSPCLPRFYDVGTTSMPFLLRWYYVNPVLTTFALGPHYALWPLRCSKFDHVLAVLADLTTLLQHFYYAHPVPTTLIRFPLRSRPF